MDPTGTEHHAIFGLCDASCGLVDALTGTSQLSGIAVSVARDR